MLVYSEMTENLLAMRREGSEDIREFPKGMESINNTLELLFEYLYVRCMVHPNALINGLEKLKERKKQQQDEKEDSKEGLSYDDKLSKKLGPTLKLDTLPRVGNDFPIVQGLMPLDGFGVFDEDRRHPLVTVPQTVYCLMLAPDCYVTAGDWVWSDTTNESTIKPQGLMVVPVSDNELARMVKSEAIDSVDVAGEGKVVMKQVGVFQVGQHNDWRWQSTLCLEDTRRWVEEGSRMKLTLI